jgi:membrane glycosyltransferase
VGRVIPASYVNSGPGTELFAIMLLMVFAPKIASIVDVLVRRSARESYGGATLFVLNAAAETLFSVLLSPVMALTHTLFLVRLFLLRRGGAWNSQRRETHAVSWRRALTALWPHATAGLAVIGIIVAAAPSDVGYALMAAGGLAWSIPFAVATASPDVGTFFDRLGVARIPEEIEPPIALLRLRLPALMAGLRRRRQARDPGR